MVEGTVSIINPRFPWQKTKYLVLLYVDTDTGEDVYARVSEDTAGLIMAMRWKKRDKNDLGFGGN